MEPRDRFRFISPLDHRYWSANREQFEALADCLGEEAAVRYAVRVELALLAELQRRLPGTAPGVPEQCIQAAGRRVTAAAVAAEERATDHNVRALVNVLQRELPVEVRHLVHLGATSHDVTDTAAALRYRDALGRVVLPLLIRLEEALIELAEREADHVQVGRTHGQYAVPVTFGFAVAEYVARLGKSILRLKRCRGDLRGKLAGAVGAYNATALLVDDPLELERAVLARLGLQPSESATQIVEPEYLLQALLELNTAFGIIANLADDLRNLQRSEIDEVREPHGSRQVGSSTMPQKRNPWNCEHVKSLWKTFAPRVMTFFLDQVSEHQRDLTNSASARFAAEFVAGLTAAANRMLRVVTGLQVDRKRMRERLRESGSDLVLAEAAYVLLAAAGDAGAHERIRRLTRACERDGGSLLAAARRDADAWERLDGAVRERCGTGAQEFFSHPERYVGRAAEQARALAARYRAAMRELGEELAAEPNGASATAPATASVAPPATPPATATVAADAPGGAD